MSVIRLIGTRGRRTQRLAVHSPDPRPSQDSRISEIDLAREPAFRLNNVEVRPSTLEVLAPGRREVLEPRVMQVLTALARRRGEVVSKDDLTDACWGGRVVGEDAIQRCIGRLRRLAGSVGGFEIETLARVGYRLSESQAPAATADARARPRPRWRLALASGLAVLVLAAGWVGLRSLRPPPPDIHRVVVLPFRLLGGDARAAAFAARVSDELVGVLNQAAIPTSAPGAGADGDLALSGTVYEEAGVMRVRVQLDDASSKLILWSSQFERPVGEAAAVRAMVAGAATEAIYSALEQSKQKGLKVSPASLAAGIRGSAALSNPQVSTRGEPLRAFQESVSLAPNSANAHADFALALAGASCEACQVGSKTDGAKLAMQARQEAARAIAIDPTQAGAAYYTLYVMESLDHPRELARREDHILQGLANAPDFPYLHMQECRFLLLVGRVEASLRYCQRAIALRPLSTPPGHTYARALFLGGRADLARSHIARLLAFHPDDFALKSVLFDIEAFSGAPGEALKLLQAPDAPPGPGVEALKLLLRARSTGADQDIASALNALRSATRQRKLDPRYLILGAAALGRIDDAFAAIDEFPTSPDPEQSYIFEPVAAPLRRDPRFWPVAVRLGLVRYWRERKVWPDFCSDRSLAIDCEGMARTVSSAPVRSAN
ncbi:MAG: transcriptional regulator, CadC [Phenylobacterium sp.]|nr:transcriptional regulator, CadC [Phenylobacterium sp.]